ncbi:MAG: ptsN [Caulobacteraceae bacterium]|nr:ptsN [Caulobacteraceae bacterium]
MHVGELLDRGGVLVRARASGKRAVLMTLADLAGRNFGLPASVALNALEERERLGSTGIGGGMAIPHARLPGLDRVRAVFLKLQQPVDFNAVDGQPVDLVLALFAPPEADADHLRALAAASRLLRSRDLMQQVRAARSSDAILALITDQARPTAA